MESIIAFASLADEIEFAPSSRLSLVVGGEHRVAAGEDNLVWRAARLLDPRAGAAVRLHKRIPPRAGLGGGSADAAAALQTLNRLWRTGKDLPSLATRLGSDVGVCLRSPQPGLFSDGDFSPVTIPDFYALLLHAHSGLSTADVYANHAEKAAEGLSRSLPTRAKDWADYFRAHGNSLLAAAAKLMPSLSESLKALAATRNCLHVGMSGSGSSCFALYESRSHAEAAAGLPRLGGRAQVVKVYGFNASTNTE